MPRCPDCRHDQSDHSVVKCAHFTACTTDNMNLTVAIIMDSKSFESLPLFERLDWTPWSQNKIALLSFQWGQDVFVSLPTEYDKWLLCYLACHLWEDLSPASLLFHHDWVTALLAKRLAGTREIYMKHARNIHACILCMWTVLISMNILACAPIALISSHLSCSPQRSIRFTIFHEIAMLPDLSFLSMKGQVLIGL